MVTLTSWQSRAGSVALCLLWAVGCGFDPGGQGGGSNADGGGSEADGGGTIHGRDGSPEPGEDAGPGPDGGGCGELLPFAPSNFDPCLLGAPNGALLLEDGGDEYLIDTDLGMLTGPGVQQLLVGAVIDQTGAPDIFVVVTPSFTLGADAVLGVDGSRAFALVATGDITIAGGLSAGAVAEGSGPGGDNEEACAEARGDNGQLQTRPPFDGAGSGGGGGGFAAAGGAGAPVDQSVDPDPTSGGAAGGEAPLVPLRGGCAGGTGGVDGLNGGDGGGGGGALQLVAGGAITVDGIVTARGGGGRGISSAVDGGAGGGGGSGGGLLLEAMTVAVNGSVTANGGAGGEGTRTGNTASPGEDGLDASGARAQGGANSSEGGDGGDGGALEAVGGANGLPGDSTPADLAGGGGGGGSAGRIRLRSISGEPAIGDQAVVSPAPQ